MKHFAGRTYLLVLMISILLFGCKKSVEEKETILKEQLQSSLMKR
jgi:phosphate transport system substrate-binding protein